MFNPAIEQYEKNYFVKKHNLEMNGAVQAVYGFSNENLRKYMKHMNIQDGKVATVGSSLDQAFYSVFLGAEAVTVIDGNPYAKPMGELKISAVKNMSLQEFNDYWQYKKIFDPKIYRHLLHDVSKSSRDFIEHVASGSVGRIFDPMSFYSTAIADGDIYKVSCSKACEFYDNEESFAKLKARLEDVDIDIRLAEFSEFPKKLEGEQYESILLSNIYNYAFSTKGFFETAKALIDGNLARHGTMQMHYRLHTSPKSKINETILTELPNYGKCKQYSFNCSVDNVIDDMDWATRFKHNFGKRKEMLDKRKEDVYIYEK